MVSNMILYDGTQVWYKNGKRHREDGPARIDPDGTQFWYLNDKLHRENGPAVIYLDGRQEFYQNSLLRNPTWLEFRVTFLPRLGWL